MMIFQVNLENTKSVSVNELKNYLIVRFFFENFQMNGLKIDVHAFRQNDQFILSSVFPNEHPRFLRNCRPNKIF